MTEQGLYAYPKAHAVVLAYLAYTTAYLKTHFPEEYTRAAMCIATMDSWLASIEVARSSMVVQP